MPSLDLPDRLIWFAHCPKAGGTSVEQMMVARWGAAVGHLHWGWDKWWSAGGWRRAAPPNSPQHLIWHDARATLARSPDAVFALVRDPVERMVSEQQWQRSGRRATWAGRLLARLPFSLWLSLMLSMARHNPYAFDNHFRPQTAFIPEGAEVFRLEDGMGQVARWLARATDTPVFPEMPHILKSDRARRPRVGPESRALIAHVFASDFKRFNYDPGVEGQPGHRAPRWPDPLVRLLARAERRGWF